MEAKSEWYNYQKERFYGESYKWSATMNQYSNETNKSDKFDFRVSCNESEIVAEACVFTENGWKNICKKFDLDLPKEIENLNPYLKSDEYKVWFRLNVEREMLIYVDNTFYPDYTDTKLRYRIKEIDELLSEKSEPSKDDVHKESYRIISGNYTGNVSDIDNMYF